MMGKVKDTPLCAEPSCAEGLAEAGKTAAQRCGLSGLKNVCARKHRDRGCGACSHPQTGGRADRRVTGGWTGGWMDGWENGWMDKWMDDGWVSGQMDG